MRLSTGRMGVLGRERRNLGGGRMSFAGFVGTSLHVDISVVAYDLFQSASGSEIEN